MESGGLPPTTNGTITVDALFENSNRRIRPFVDYAFSDGDLANALKQTTAAMNATTNDILRNLLLAKLNDLKLKRAELSGKPPAVAELEGVMEDEIPTTGNGKRNQSDFGCRARPSGLDESRRHDD